MDSRFRSLTPRPEKLTERTVIDPLSLIDEEDSSSSKHLILIHKELDKIKSDNRKKQTLINKLKRDISAAKRSSSIINEDKMSLDQRVEHLENYLETVIQKRKEEESDMKSYNYLLERIKEDKHALDKELKKQQIDFNRHKRSYNFELSKSKKMTEVNLKEKLEIQNLNQTISKEKKAQNETLSLIEKKALDRSRAVTMLEESSKHREMIAEAAQGQVSNLETIELRNRTLLCRMWYFWLNKKLQKESEKGEVLEEPFQKIKITTGMKSVEEILTRYLTREEAYKDLVSAVKESETNLRDLKSKLDEAYKTLRELQLKEGNEQESPEEDLLRVNMRSIMNFKDMRKKYKILIKNLVQWGQEQLISIGVHKDSDGLEEILQSLSEETEKLMKKVKEKIVTNPKVLEDVMFLSTSSMISKNSFSKFFENNCRISPRKQSHAEDDAKLLLGKY